VTAEVQNQLSPEQLALKCQAGCRDSFEQLVELFEERIFNYLCQRLENRHDAEDVTQETFVKAYRGIQRYDSTYAFSTWLFTIAKRTLANHFRSAHLTLPETGEGEVDLDDPAILLEQKDESLALWHTAKSLKPDQYEALWLRYGEGFSIAETSRIMKTNQVRVRVLLHRARHHLATILPRGQNPPG
jgi:RNA polymerase sigma-70 factor (ECF subfamily)